MIVISVLPTLGSVHEIGGGSCVRNRSITMEKPMPYVYEEAESLEKLPTVGTKQCVALIKQYTKALPSSLWKEGVKVMGNVLLKKELSSQPS